jgi:hypothetical protein
MITKQHIKIYYILECNMDPPRMRVTGRHKYDVWFEVLTSFFLKQLRKQAWAEQCQAQAKLG